MKKSILFVVILVVVMGGEVFSQNRFANTTWEVTPKDGERITISFGETGYKWTVGEDGGAFVGTYKVQGEMVYLTMPGIMSGTDLHMTGILMGEVLTISISFGNSFDFRRVQSNTSSLHNTR